MMYHGKIHPLLLKKLEHHLKVNRDNVPKDILYGYNQKIYQVLISFEKEEDREEFIKKNRDLTILEKFQIIPSIRINLTELQIKQFEKVKLIKSIEEDLDLYLAMDDSFDQLKLAEYRSSSMVYTGYKILIGIIDEGINVNLKFISRSLEYKNEELNPFRKKHLEKDHVENITHGSLMTGIITTHHSMKGYLMGVAPKAKIVDLPPRNQNGRYLISDLLKLFDILVSEQKRVNILLISFSTFQASDGADILCLACDKLVEEYRIQIICPAGNSGPEFQTIGSPAAAKKVIAIGALTKSKKVAYYSSRGPTLDGRNKPDICFLGSKISIPLSKNKFITFSGTCAAAAIATGIIATLLEYNENLSSEGVLECLKNACQDLGYDKNSQGWGTTDMIRLYDSLGLYQEKKLSYTYLMKVSLKFTLIIILLLIFIFYFRFILAIFQV